ncbi:MAG: large subunit ribosomal protein L9 [Candidatus Deianiraeaceae bacterium]|jgi:large subunit ribosomal protein L9
MSQVILKENIRKIGRIGDVVTVKDGFAFNYLIPQNKAIPATQSNLINLEKQREKMLEEDNKNKDVAQTLATTIPAVILLARDINENGSLYGSISSKDIIEEIPSITNKHAIHLEKHIHLYGVYNVEIDLHHDVIVNIKLSISDTKDNAQKQIDNLSKKKESTPKKINDEVKTSDKDPI